VASAVHGGASRIVVAGGDGTVHHAFGAFGALTANGITAPTLTIGIVPVGTGNDIAGALGLPTSLEAAVTTSLEDGDIVDIIDTGSAPIVSVATIGFSVDVNDRANGMRWPRGSARYNIATVRELPGLQTRPITLTVDGVAHDLDVTLLAVGNTSNFGGGMKICPAANATDGLLDVTVIGRVGRLELLRVFPRVFKGTHLTHRAVRTFRGATVRIESRNDDRGTPSLWGDGEPVSSLPCGLRAVSSGIRVAGFRASTT
jgi:diacylglycerol kinase (ATP)